MKLEIKVPAMGESISEATIGQIFKPTGTTVAMDDEILELETDKVNQVLYAPQSGTVTLTVSQNDVVKIGQAIGSIDSEAAVKQQPGQEEIKKEEPKPKQEEQRKPKPEKTEQKTEEKAKPIAASAHSAVRQTKDDFLAGLAEAKPSEKKKETTQTPVISGEVKPSGQKNETRKKIPKIRKVIASRLVEVQRTTAMLTTFNEVDMSQIIALREKYKDSFAKKYQAKLGFMSFFVKASVSALKAFPEINSYIDGDDFVHREYYDIGIAVGTDRGLIVPVVRNCDQRSLAEVESAIEQFAAKARDGTITVDDLQGGSFTITNGGVYGSLLSTPILNPPQSAILGMHKIMKRPVAVDDQVVIRPMMYLALSYDHRIVDGKEAVSFLIHIKNILEDPARLLIGI